MSMYIVGVASLLAIVLLLGILVQYKLIITNSTHKLLSAPSFRRRHRSSTPLTGGVGIVITFLIAMITITPYFGLDLLFRFLPIGMALATVFVVGLLDDMYTISPKLKLLGELVAASMVLLSPDIQEFAFEWQKTIGFAIWPLILFWIVGVTNAINLIDGLDGLAGSYVFMALGAMAVSWLVSGQGRHFEIPLIGAMITSIIPFLIFNRNPARVFLGDNGSLLLGFFVATFSLLNPGGTSGWTETVSIMLIAGLPILDMAWVTWIRIRRGFSPFTADRSHIHYRLLKFKLSVNEVVTLLMGINLIFLVGSYMIARSTTKESLLVMTIGFVSIYMLLKLVHNYDRWKNAILEESPQRPALVEKIPEDSSAVMVVDVKPLFQALETTDQKVIEGALDSLFGYLQMNFQRKDGYYLMRQRAEFQLAIHGDPDMFFNLLSDRLKHWLHFNDIAISLPNFPITIVESSKWVDANLDEAA